MSDEQPQRTATIYQFPVRARKNEDSQPTEMRLPRVANGSFGGAWYHEAAIEETKRAGERG